MLITVRQGAEILGLNVNVAYQKINRGEFPAGVVVKIGAAVRFNRERLGEWIDAGGSLSVDPRKNEAQSLQVIQARA